MTPSALSRTKPSAAASSMDRHSSLSASRWRRLASSAATRWSGVAAEGRDKSEEFGRRAVPFEMGAMHLPQGMSRRRPDRAWRIVFWPGASSSAGDPSAARRPAGLGESRAVGIAQPVERQPVGVKHSVAARHDQAQRRGFGQGGSFAAAVGKAALRRDGRRRGGRAGGRAGGGLLAGRCGQAMAAPAGAIRGAGLRSARAERPRDFAKGRTLVRRERDQGGTSSPSSRGPAPVSGRAAACGRKGTTTPEKSCEGGGRFSEDSTTFAPRARLVPRARPRGRDGRGLKRIRDKRPFAQTVEMDHAKSAPAVKSAARVEKRQAADGHRRDGASLFDGPVDIDPAEGDAPAQGLRQVRRADRARECAPRRENRARRDRSSRIRRFRQGAA